MLTAASWLLMQRSRCLFLLLCSPLLLSLLCATFPILCAAEIFIRLYSRRTGMTPSSSADCAALPLEAEEDEQLRRCEEGCCWDGVGEEEEREPGLLQRYLEDQLLLVRSVYDCGDDCGYDNNDHDGPDPDHYQLPDCSGVPLLS